MAGLGHLISLPKPRSLSLPWGHQAGGWVPTGEWAGGWVMEEGKCNGGRIKRRGGVFCPSTYKKVTVSQISPPLHRPAPHDLWPLYFWVNAETEWGKGGGRAQGETHPPRVSGDKRGPQPRLAESVRGTNAQATITKQSHQRLHISTASACSQPLHGPAFHD